MDGLRLRALSNNDLGSVYKDCGFSIGRRSTSLNREQVIEHILAWQRKWCGQNLEHHDESEEDTHGEQRRPPATPLHAATKAKVRCLKTPCKACGWQPAAGLCACCFFRLDPLRPVALVKSLVHLSPDSHLRPFHGSAVVNIEGTALSDGAHVELRMVRVSDPERHIWPESVAVSVDATEVFCLGEPKNGTRRRGDAPLDLTEHFCTAGRRSLRIQACTRDFRISELVFCVVQTHRQRTVESIMSDCLSAPEASEEDAVQLCTSLEDQQGSAEKEDVLCTSPMLQPLTCPLTCDRIEIPARGKACKHLRCFDLKAYLNTSASVAFHRRWHCPVCSTPLLPSGLLVCSLTKRLLAEAGEFTTSASLAPYLHNCVEHQAGHAPLTHGIAEAVADATAYTNTSILTCGSNAPSQRRRFRRWKSGVLSPHLEPEAENGLVPPLCENGRSASSAPLAVKRADTASVVGAWGIHRLLHRGAPADAPVSLD